MATEKALSPQVQCLVSGGRKRRWALEDRRLQEGGVGEVGGGLVIEGFEGEKDESFKM